MYATLSIFVIAIAIISFLPEGAEELTTENCANKHNISQEISGNIENWKMCVAVNVTKGVTVNRIFMQSDNDKAAEYFAICSFLENTWYARSQSKLKVTCAQTPGTDDIMMCVETTNGTDSDRGYYTIHVVNQGQQEEACFTSLFLEESTTLKMREHVNKENDVSGSNGNESSIWITIFKILGPLAVVYVIIQVVFILIHCVRRTHCTFPRRTAAEEKLSDLQNLEAVESGEGSTDVTEFTEMIGVRPDSEDKVDLYKDRSKSASTSGVTCRDQGEHSAKRLKDPFIATPDHSLGKVYASDNVDLMATESETDRKLDDSDVYSDIVNVTEL